MRGRPPTYEGMAPHQPEGRNAKSMRLPARLHCRRTEHGQDRRRDAARTAAEVFAPRLGMMGRGGSGHTGASQPSSFSSLASPRLFVLVHHSSKAYLARTAAPLQTTCDFPNPTRGARQAAGRR